MNPNVMVNSMYFPFEMVIWWKCTIFRQAQVSIWCMFDLWLQIWLFWSCDMSHPDWLQQGCSTVDQIDATLLINIVTSQQKFQSSQDLQSFHQCTCIRSPLKIETCNYIYSIYIYIFILYNIYTISFKKTKQLPLGKNGRIRRLVYHKLPISSLCLPYFGDTPACRPSY